MNALTVKGPVRRRPWYKRLWNRLMGRRTPTPAERVKWAIENERLSGR